MTKIKASAEDIVLRDITELSKNDALTVLSIRNQPAVRNNMYTCHEIRPDEHFSWIERLRGRNTTKFYAVIYDGEIVGGAGISDINTLHGRADWAFYLSENCQGKGIGSALEKAFVTFAFDQFEIEKLNCEVIDFNERVIAMHEHCGFQREGVRREHVTRDGRKHDAVLLGVTKTEWRERRSG